MSTTIEAIAADREALLTMCEQASDSWWRAESGCPGWSVQDLISHLGCSFWLAVDPTNLPDPQGLPAERAADLYVDSRRWMTPDDVVADYASVSAKGLDMLAAVEDQDVEIPLGDVGTYPASVIPTAFAFEEFVHIRYDLFAPNGPMTGNPPPTDELRLAPTLDWIEASLPQQNEDLLSGLDSSVEIRLEGLCARTVRIGDGADVAARITSDSAAFVRWVTQRGTWEDLGVEAAGDPSTIDIARQLRAF